MKLTESLLGSRIVNALGQRIQKIGAGQFTYNSSDILPPSTRLSARAVTLAYNARYVYDEQGRLLGEYSPEGKLIAETIWFDDLRVATLRPTGSSNQMPLGGEGIANNTGANDESDPVDVEIYYVHPDHLGTPRVVTRSVSKGRLGPSVANKAVWRWDSDPFGSSIGNSKPNENPQGVTGMASQVTAASFRVNNRFPGQLADAESGKYYNYFRDYDPAIGRYVESDPIGLKGGLTTFAYVGDNPLAFSDPLGLAKFCCRLLNSIAGWGLRQRHCYLVADDGNVYGLYPEKISGQDVGLPRKNDPRDAGGECVDCPAKDCSDQNQCLKNGYGEYPVGGYSTLGPNSNTFAGSLAKRCCKGGVPSGAGSAPGIDDAPPPPTNRR